MRCRATGSRPGLRRTGAGARGHEAGPGAGPGPIGAPPMPWKHTCRTSMPSPRTERRRCPPRRGPRPGPSPRPVPRPPRQPPRRLRRPTSRPRRPNRDRAVLCASAPPRRSPPRRSARPAARPSERSTRPARCGCPAPVPALLRRAAYVRVPESCFRATLAPPLLFPGPRAASTGQRWTVS